MASSSAASTNAAASSSDPDHQYQAACHNPTGQLVRPDRTDYYHVRGVSMADLVASSPAGTTTAQAAQSTPNSSSLSRGTRQGPSNALQSSRSRQQHSSADHRARNASVVDSHLNAGGLDLLNIDVSQLQVDSDSSDNDYQPAGRSAHTTSRQHARSISNPFPSLFSQKKKKGKTTQHGFGDSDTSDGEVPTAMGAVDDPHAVPGTGESNRKAGFLTGPCITCGTIMRWACGVKVFRCGICMTINDFAPIKSSSTSRSASDFRVPSPISVQETRNLAHQCLRAYLEHVLLDVVDPSSRGTSQLPSGNAQQPPVSAVPNLDGQALGRPLHHGHEASGTRIQPTSREPRHTRGPSFQYPPSNGASLPSSRSHHIPMPSSHSSPQVFRGHPSAANGAANRAANENADEKEAKRIFRLLEDYIVSRFLSIDCLNSSFVPTGPHKESQPQDASQTAQSASPSTLPSPVSDRRAPALIRSCPIPESDPVFPKDASRNKSGAHPAQAASGGHQRHKSEAGISNTTVTNPSRPICIDWHAVDEWYNAILYVAAPWTDIYEDLVARGACQRPPNLMLEEIEARILIGQRHAQRTLLKVIETILKRPGRRISESGDFRFLIISLANPLLHTNCAVFTGRYQPRRNNVPHPSHSKSGRGNGPVSGKHSVIIKRILGLMSNSSDEWHNRMITCFAQFSEARFVQMKDLVGSFLAYRLVRYNEKKEEERKTDFTDSLVPKVAAEGVSVASYHAALSQAAHRTGGTSAAATAAAKTTKEKPRETLTHGDDWQIKAAVRVMRLLFIANFSKEFATRPGSTLPLIPISAAAVDGEADAGRVSHSRRRGQFLQTSDFYMTLLDNCDLVADYEVWENRRAKFSFCQYPFLLSVWAKIRILEWEARRQMQSKARDAFFDSILTHRSFDQYLVLNVRRDCLVEDSLTSVSSAIGTGGDDIKKGIRIVFTGEEGIDAGGLRKEWFLLLVRELFNPDHGMFVYDDESQYCYFNPASFENSDQFFLVGVVLGLAIHNSTILDVALPPYVFRKLLAEAPAKAAGPMMGLPRPALTHSLEDLAEFRPSLARGLQQLLDYDGGDVQSTFCLDFTVTVERYGAQEVVPLCAGGEARPVTEANRAEYVRLYARYVLETAVARQFEPFKRGFFTVCGCNALSLFRPEEIELLVRGSDEALDIASLRVAASYDNWATPDPLAQEPTLQWFWQAFAEAPAADQRRLLVFITGSDRIPATGPASLSIRILCLGEDTGRYPTARTCFNTLTLYRYASKERLQKQLWIAVNESEGFGLK